MVGDFKGVVLPNGDVLALLPGGFTELYNPATGNWSTAGTGRDHSSPPNDPNPDEPCGPLRTTVTAGSALGPSLRLRN